MKYLFIIFLACFYNGFSQNPQEDYKIYHVSEKKEISLQELIDELSKSEVIFFGEEHNDSIAHVLQYEVFLGLRESTTRKLILSMEMFQTDVQLVVEEYMEDLISERNFERDARKWNNYNDYKPLVEFAKSNGIYVLAANAPTRYTNMVTSYGLESLELLSKEAKKLLPPLPIDTLTGRYYDKFAGLMGGHEGMGNLKIYQTQNLWDATMAWKIAEMMKKKPSSKLLLHLNGRFHTDEKLGTFAQLKKYAPRLKAVNISSFSHPSYAAPDWDEWTNLGDFIIITKP